MPSWPNCPGKSRKSETFENLRLNVIARSASDMAILFMKLAKINTLM